MKRILFLLKFGRRRWRDKNGFFEKVEERRPERSRGCFVGTVDDVGSSEASSAQLKHLETSGSGGFGVRIGDFSVFCTFFANPADAGRVLRSVEMVGSAGDSVGDGVSKTARKDALFSCPLPAGCCDELAGVVNVGGPKATLLEVIRLVWARTTSFVC